MHIYIYTYTHVYTFMYKYTIHVHLCRTTYDIRLYTSLWHPDLQSFRFRQGPQQRRTHDANADELLGELGDFDVGEIW